METKVSEYAVHKDALTSFSRGLQEPEWMLEMRLDALDKIDELEPPVIERLRYNRWPLWQVPNLTGAPSAKAIDPFEFIEDKA
ncbi:MAG: Fe-S cluster assembly protein SufD, partial [Alkalibacterium sp.]